MRTTCTQHTWTAPDGSAFSYSRWAENESTAKPAAVMLAVHGLSGAALDFEPLGAHLAPLGFVTYAPELRGQGNDPLPARRGDLDSIETWFSDLRAFVALLRQAHPSLPLFYYGESMGGAILTRFLAQAGKSETPRGLILASPVIALQQVPPLWMNLLFQTLRILRPRFRVDVRRFAKKGEAPKHVTRDEAHRTWFQSAPHKLDSFTIRFFTCLRGLIEGCQQAATQIDVPVLVLYAQNDVFIRTDLVEAFFERLAGQDKQLVLYAESYHLLLHDFDRDQVLAQIEDWLASRG